MDFSEFTNTYCTNNGFEADKWIVMLNNMKSIVTQFSDPEMSLENFLKKC